MPRMEDVEKEPIQKKVEKSNEPNYWEIKDLPSKGKLYPKNTKIMGRSLKVIEVKKLSSMTEDNADAVLNDVLRRSIKGIEIEDLLVSDKLYVIFWLRANTYREPGYTVDYKCSLCNQDSSYEFSLDNLQVQYLPDDFTPEKLTVEMKNEDTLEFRMPTVADERKMNKFKISYSSILKEIDDELISYSIMINRINGKEVDILEKYNYLLDLSPADYSYLTTKIGKFDCGIKPLLEVKCKKCGGIGPVGISFREDFFLPKYSIE